MASGELEDGKDPGEIFAFEIWDQILSNLTRPEDLTNCFNSCHGLRKLLEPRRTTFIPELMSKVLQLIDDRVGFSHRDVFRLRRVSNTWKASIDLFLQRHPHHTDIGFSKCRPIPDYFAPFHMFRTGNFGKLEQFVGKANTFPTADPFFSRTIRYQEYGSSNESYTSVRVSQFRDGTRRTTFHAPIRLVPHQRNLFRQILARFGERLWHATFVFILSKTDSQAFYKLVRSFLRLMPSLRSLTIKVEDGLGHLHEMTPKLKRLMIRRPLPPLEHLIFLGMRNIQEPVQSGLLQTYKHIKRLSFQNSTGSRPSFSPNSFPNLEFNSLVQLRTFNYCMEDIQMLHSKAGAWPLTHINLRWIQVTDLPQVFQAISAFSETLKHLQIEFRGVRAHEFEKAVDLKLDLPHLESIKITCVQSYLNVLDFLLPCVQLNKIELEIWIPSVAVPSFDSPPQAIQFGGCASAMYNSNIWRILSNLERMVIRTVTNHPDTPETALHNSFFYSRAWYLRLMGAQGIANRDTR